MIEEKTFNPDGVGVDNGNYFGLPFTPDESALVLISAPWDVTVSYGEGTAYGPDAIIEASTQLDFYDPMTDDAWREGIATDGVDEHLAEASKRLRVQAEKVITFLEEGGDQNDEHIQKRLAAVNAGCREMNENICAQARKWLDKGKLVGLVGGDHSTSYGAVKALGEKHQGFGILHIDAHCDLRDSYEGFEYSHASVMFNILRDVPAVEKIVQVGVRDFSRGEVEFARESQRVEMFDDMTLAGNEFCGQTWDEQCRRIVGRLPQEVYVSFDIDGLSFDNCPHTGTPVCGGLSFNKAVWLLRCIVESGRRIIGFDVVEVAPAPDGSGKALINIDLMNTAPLSPKERIDAITGARILWKLCCFALKSNQK